MTSALCREGTRPLSTRSSRRNPASFTTRWATSPAPEATPPPRPRRTPPAFEPVLHDSGDEERAFLRLDYDVGDKDHRSLLGSFARNFYQIPVDPTSMPCDPAQPSCGRLPDSYGNAPATFFPLDTNATQ